MDETGAFATDVFDELADDEETILRSGQHERDTGASALR